MKGEAMDLLETHLWMMDLIYKAGSNIRKKMGQNLAIEEKTSFRDIVTNMDKETEDFFAQNIRTRFPEHQIMGEEGKNNQFTSMQGYIWIIDPIDGTMNFVKQRDNFGIMISLFCDGIGLLGYLYDVVQDKMCFAIKGYGAYLNNMQLPQAKDIGITDSLMNIGDCVMRTDAKESRELLNRALAFRSVGSAALAEMAVFEGKICAYLNYKLYPWDISPAIVIAEELGYVCETIDGKKVDLLKKTTFIVGTKRAVEEIKNIVRNLSDIFKY